MNSSAPSPARLTADGNVMGHAAVMVESARPLCHEHDCLERAELLAARSSRSSQLPVCDRHALLEALRAERNGYALVLTAVRDWARYRVPQQHCG